MIRYIFFGVFFISFICQMTLWSRPYMMDVVMWKNQAEYVDNNDPKQFDMLAAYGHPGGPLILGPILIHKVFDINYSTQLLIGVLAFLNSLTIAFIALICFLIRKNSIWWLVVASILSFHYLYIYATPPSALASLVFVLLCLFTFYLYEDKLRIDTSSIFLWSLTSGFLVATRADIGIVASSFLAIILIPKMGFRNFLLTCICAFGFFITFNPFMWFMPLRHMGDLLYKVTYHYSNFSPTTIPAWLLFDIFFMSLISIFIFLTISLFRKKITLPVPLVFGFSVFLMTVTLCTIFLTSNYQALRYFMPLIFIWETLLVLFIFHIISLVDSLKKKQNLFGLSKADLIKFSIAIILVFLHFIIFLNSLVL